MKNYDFNNIKVVENYDDFLKILKNTNSLFPVKQSKKNNKTNFSQYLSENIFWYRGQASFRWNLMPNLYRIIDKNNFWRELKIEEQKRIRLFKIENYHKFPVKTPENDYLWMSIMQHYRSKTRLLDWSMSAETAFFFAIHSYFNSDLSITSSSLPCVWILKPYEMRQSKEIGNLLVQPYGFYDNSFPIPVLAPYNSERIKSQEGAFTIFPNSYTKKDKFSGLHYLESIPDANYFLCQIIILKPVLSNLLLNKIGSHVSRYYPEMTSISEEIEELLQKSK